MAQAAFDAASLGSPRTNQESLLGEGEAALCLAWDAVPLLDADNRIMGAILSLKNITREMNLKLTVTLGRVQGQVWISFTDNGPGISEENLKNIFRPFFTTKAKGTGLGLCVSKKIMEDMGAGLRFDSTPGQGTTAHIFFPQKLLVPPGATGGREPGAG